MTQIKAPRVDVLLANDEQHTAQLMIPDQIQWSRTSRARGWDPSDEILAQTFMVWHALKRQGIYTDTWENFSERDAVWAAEHEETDDEQEASEQDPTDPAS